MRLQKLISYNFLRFLNRWETLRTSGSSKENRGYSWFGCFISALYKTVLSMESCMPSFSIGYVCNCMKPRMWVMCAMQCMNSMIKFHVFLYIHETTINNRKKLYKLYCYTIERTNSIKYNRANALVPLGFRDEKKKTVRGIKICFTLSIKSKNHIGTLLQNNFQSPSEKMNFCFVSFVRRVKKFCSKRHVWRSNQSLMGTDRPTRNQNSF